MQPDDAMTDAALDRELERALAVDPSPEFVARVRMRVANEPARAPWRTSWMFAMSAVAAVIVAAIVIQLVNRGRSPVAETPLLKARATASTAGTLLSANADRSAEAFAPRPSYVASAFRRTSDRSAEPIALQAEALLDPRESAALRALITGAGSGRLDLSPVLRASTPTAMDLPPVEDIDIPVLTIEPLAPIGAEGVRQ